jgi:hypothetical protein
MRFDAKASSEQRAGGVRFVEHLYRGPVPVRQVEAFYRREMPLAGWRTRQETFSEGRRRLVFDKDNETCYVSIWDEWGTRLLVQVFPKGQAQPAR